MSYLGRKKGAFKRKVKRKIIPGYGKSTRQKLGLSNKRKKQKTQAEKESDRLFWQFVISVLLVIGGFASFSKSFVSAVCMIAAGIVLCPLINIKTLYRAVIIIFCLLLGGMTYPDTADSAAETERTGHFFDENGERAYFPTTTAAETTETDTTTTKTITTTAVSETTTAEETTTTAEITTQAQKSYVINTSTGKIHNPYCSSVDKIKSGNRWDYTGTMDELLSYGYAPCKSCDPY